jgi:hypothetical protein
MHWLKSWAQFSVLHTAAARWFFGLPTGGPNPTGYSFMASALTDKLSRLVKQISGQARITESNVDRHAA